MKTIFRVAKTELYTLFYSPIAWFLIIVFLVQCGVIYLGQLDQVARTQELGGMYITYLDTLTQRVFLSAQGLFGSVMQNLFLYIPLLTMSLISRETSSGTIKLLYSSPVKVREIVLGKYLAMIVYSLLLVAIIGIFIISGTVHIQSPDTGMLMTALLGFFLLLCAYAAIGLFMSALTSYQVVAAICTFVMIGVLSYIGSLWQDIAFVRNLTYFLSINGRTQKMLSGLVTTKDIIYFIIIVYMFVAFTIYRLKGGMESKHWMVKAGRYAATLASALLIGYVSSLPGMIGYWDATANKTRTLTPNAQKIIKELGNEPLEITAYTNLLEGHWYLGTPSSYNDNLARWEPYMRFKSNIKLNTVIYYDTVLGNSYAFRGYEGKTLKEIALQTSKSVNIPMKGVLTPEEIRKQIDLRPELNRYVMQLKWKDKTTWLRVFDDQAVWPGETEVAAAFKRLQQARMPRVLFAAGELERSIDKSGDRDYQAITNLSTFRYSLINQGFDVDTISLDAREVPAGIATLVIADPKMPLSERALIHLKQYINKGGNLLIAGEPGKQAVMNPILQPLGVQLMEGMLIQESKDQAPTLVAPDPTKVAGGFTKALQRKMADSPKVSMPGAAALSYNNNGDFTIQPLLLTDPLHSWNRMKPLDIELAVSASINNASGVTLAGSVPAVAIGQNNTAKSAALGTVTFSAADGDIRGTMPTAISLTRKLNNKEQRIVVAGDADFMSNAELQRYNLNTVNFVFNTALFSWLSEGQFPIDTSRPEAKDKRVNVSSDEVAFLRIIYIWLLPALILAAAAILLIRRKRK